MVVDGVIGVFVCVLYLALQPLSSSWEGNGGAMFTSDGAFTTFRRNVNMSDNRSASHGGGIYNAGSTEVARQAFFEENHAAVRLT